MGENGIENAGIGFTGAIAVTSRAHRNYDRAITEIEARCNAVTA